MSSEPVEQKGQKPELDLSLAARAAPAFAIVASVGYLFCMGFNLSPFAYYPEVRQFHVSPQPKTLGPPMFWYGWILYAIAAGVVAAGIACVLPRRTGAALAGPLSWLVWAVPTGVILAHIYFLRFFFQ